MYNVRNAIVGINKQTLRLAYSFTEMVIADCTVLLFLKGVAHVIFTDIQFLCHRIQKKRFVQMTVNIFLNLFDDKDIRKTHYLVPDKRSTSFKAFGKLALQGGDNSPDSNNKFARSVRLSEAYLNKAEAEAMMFLEGMGEEHKTEAVNLLKTMWSKKIDEVPSSYLDDRTAASLVKTVRNERRRELCFEDHRWFDLRRQGMPKINHKWMGDHSDSQVTTYELTKNDPMYTLQIPENVMVRNDKLIQNPAGPIRVGQ